MGQDLNDRLCFLFDARLILIIKRSLKAAVVKVDLHSLLPDNCSIRQSAEIIDRYCIAFDHALFHLDHVIFKQAKLDKMLAGDAVFDHKNGICIANRFDGGDRDHHSGFRFGLRDTNGHELAWF